MPALRLLPITLRQAQIFIASQHRHAKPPQGWKFGVGATHGSSMIGVVVVGRPVSRKLDDGQTLEITRCCSNGHPNACSFLMGAACRAAKALGYRRIITYTTCSEDGGSLRAAGFSPVFLGKGGGWSRAGRMRDPGTLLTPRTRWQRVLVDEMLQEATGCATSMSGWCPHAQARKACEICRQDPPRGRVGELVELMIDQARQHRKWKADKTKKAFEVAVPATGIAFMFSDKRRIEFTRAQLAQVIEGSVKAVDNSELPDFSSLKDPALEGAVQTLFQKALQA